MANKDIQCPSCGCGELVNPNEKDVTKMRLNIRAHKVFAEGKWMSHCIPCDKWF